MLVFLLIYTQPIHRPLLQKHIILLIKVLTSCVIIAYSMASGTPTYAWDATISATTTTTIGNIAVDKAGSFYVAGQMRATTNLAYGSQLMIRQGLNSSAVPRDYNYSITAPTVAAGTYLAKLSASDGSVQWVTRATTTSTTSMDNQASCM